MHNPGFDDTVLLRSRLGLRDCETVLVLATLDGNLHVCSGSAPMAGTAMILQQRQSTNKVSLLDLFLLKGCRSLVRVDRH